MQNYRALCRTLRSLKSKFLRIIVSVYRKKEKKEGRREGKKGEGRKGEKR